MTCQCNIQEYDRAIQNSDILPTSSMLATFHFLHIANALNRWVGHSPSPVVLWHIPLILLFVHIYPKLICCLLLQWHLYSVYQDTSLNIGRHSFVVLLWLTSETFWKTVLWLVGTKKFEKHHQVTTRKTYCCHVIRYEFNVYMKEIKNLQACFFFLILQKIPALCTMVLYVITLYTSSCDGPPTFSCLLFFAFQLFIYYIFLIFLESSWCFFLSNLFLPFILSAHLSLVTYSFLHSFHLDTFSIVCNTLPIAI